MALPPRQALPSGAKFCELDVSFVVACELRRLTSPAAIRCSGPSASKPSPVAGSFASGPCRRVVSRVLEGVDHGGFGNDLNDTHTEVSRVDSVMHFNVGPRGC